MRLKLKMRHKRETDVSGWAWLVEAETNEPVIFEGLTVQHLPGEGQAGVAILRHIPMEETEDFPPPEEES